MDWLFIFFSSTDPLYYYDSITYLISEKQMNPFAYY